MNQTDKRRRTRRIPTQVRTAVAAVESKKAADVVVLDMTKAGAFTDYFVICSGSSRRQVGAIADAVLDALAESGVRPAHVEGHEHADWILLDYFDFVVHVFSPETRLFYGLERLWGNAERVVS